MTTTPHIQLDDRTDEGIRRIALHGEVDVATLATLRTAFEELRHVRHPAVVDLRRVTFLDCAGLSALLDLQVGARRNGARVFFAGPLAGPVRRLFDLTGCHSVFDWL